jgi:hypothetical protein
MGLSEERLAKIKLRLDEASPGPWGWWDIKDNGSSAGFPGPDLRRWQWGDPAERIANDRTWGLSREEDQMRIGPQVLVLESDDYLPSAADATFIAYSREDVELLVAEVERLRRWCGWWYGQTGD